MNAPKSKLTHIFKFMGLIAIVSSIFGVSYQKGMIIGMNFGNLNGNYDIREIFNSAVFGYIELFNLVSDQSIFDLLLSGWEILIVFLIFGLSIPILYRLRQKLDENPENVKIFIREFLDRITSSYIWPPLLSAFTGIFFIFIQVIFYHLILAVLLLLLLPALLGYGLGTSKISTIMDNPPCVKVTNEMLEEKYIRQCTHLKINGIEINANILLENSNAYFLHLNDSFLYYKKDGNVCMSSKFKKSEDLENLDRFEFMENQTDSLCNTIKPRETGNLQSV